MYKVEYLIAFDTKNQICKDVKGFNSLIKTNSDLDVKENKILFKGSPYSYKVDGIEVDKKDITVYHVVFSASRSTDKYREMLRAFSVTVGKLSEKYIQKVWDDLSLEYSEKLYPEINKVENLMRKLINKFMLINLGIDWHNSTTPKDVEDSVKRKGAKLDHRILYELDFIKLSNYLFDSYSLKDPAELPNVIENLTEEERTEEIVNIVEDYVPKNNWDRYFSDLLDVESKSLKKKWGDLYQIRNEIAHSRLIDESDYNRGKSLSEEITKILGDALEELKDIEIPEENIEEVSKNTIASGVNSYYEDKLASDILFDPYEVGIQAKHFMEETGLNIVGNEFTGLNSSEYISTSGILGDSDHLIDAHLNDPRINLESDNYIRLNSTKLGPLGPMSTFLENQNADLNIENENDQDAKETDDNE